MTIVEQIPNLDNTGGAPLTRLLDRKAALYEELHAVDYAIYQELANQQLSQIGALAALFDARLTAVERGR